jgi:hypothetical protein
MPPKIAEAKMTKKPKPVGKKNWKRMKMVSTPGRMLRA